MREKEEAEVVVVGGGPREGETKDPGTAEEGNPFAVAPEGATGPTTAKWCGE